MVSTAVMLVVLFAAFLHASWNAIVKSSPDKFLDIVFVTSGASVICGLILPFLPAPLPASWPYLAATALIHIAYFLLIGAAYRSGDMGHAYPLMRGGAPLLVALASLPLIGERLSAGEWGGILLICGGVLGLLLVNRREGFNAASSSFALLNAFVIAAYTLVDGTGVRLAGNPVAYTAWIFILTAPPIFIWMLVRRRRHVARYLYGRWPLALLGGACTLGAYILVLWAMMRAPVAVVAALRESAIIFGTAISAFVLKERFGWGRPIAAATILLGVAALKLT